MKKEELKHLIFESIGEQIKNKDEYHVDYDVGFSDEEIMDNEHIKTALETLINEAIEEVLQEEYIPGFSDERIVDDPQLRDFVAKATDILMHRFGDFKGPKTQFRIALATQKGLNELITKLFELSKGED